MASLRPSLSRLYGTLGLIVFAVLHTICVGMAIFGDEPRGIIAGLMWSYGMAIYACILLLIAMAGAFVVLASLAAAIISCLDLVSGKDDP